MLPRIPLSEAREWLAMLQFAQNQYFTFPASIHWMLVKVEKQD